MRYTQKFNHNTFISIAYFPNFHVYHRCHLSLTWQAKPRFCLCPFIYFIYKWYERVDVSKLWWWYWCCYCCCCCCIKSANRINIQWVLIFFCSLFFFFFAGFIIIRRTTALKVNKWLNLLFFFYSFSEFPVSFFLYCLCVQNTF